MTVERLRASLADRYVIERELGQGGMATVYLAHDRKHDRDVALKVLRPELAAVLGAGRFLREIRITARLDHPHILTLIDSGESDGFLWYVVPYVRGESLRDTLARERQLGLDEALRITHHIAGALEYAHRQGVVHRDIKPENILLHEGEAVLTDFGIALAVKEAGGNRLTESGWSLGTPQYMSPEQATGERALDARSDVYSLAAVLYEMLAGEAPHTGATAQAVIAKLLTERPTRLRVIRDTVPEGVDAGVARALAKVPADRFESVAAFARALEASPASSARARRARHAKRIATVILGMVVMASAVVLVVGSFGHHGERTFVTRERSQVTFSGDVTAPAISPDGKQVGYAVKECTTRARCTYGIEIKDLSSGTRRRLVEGAMNVEFLTWSPDRRFLTFSGTMAPGYGSYIVSTVGGEPRFLGRVWAEFSSGGDSLLLTPHVSRDSIGWVKVATLEGVTRDSLPISQPGDGLGRTLSLGPWFIQVVFRSGHREWRLVDRGGHQRDVFRPPETLSLSFYRSTPDALWIWLQPRGSMHQAVIRLPVDHDRGRFVGRADTILITPQTSFDVTADGRGLAYVQGSHEYDLWTMELGDARGGRMAAKHHVMHSTSDLDGELSPDGQRILVEHREVGPAGERQVLSVLPYAAGTATLTHAPDTLVTRFHWMLDDRSFAYAERGAAGARFVTVDTHTGTRLSTFPVSDSSVVDFAPLPEGGWAWIAPSWHELRIQRAGETTPHDLLPNRWRDAFLWDVTGSSDGAQLAVFGNSATSDTQFIDVITMSNGRVARWSPVQGQAPQPWLGTWRDDGSLVVEAVDTAGVWSMYRMTGPGSMKEIGRFPPGEAWFSVSRDGRRALGWTEDAQGDVWVARVSEVGASAR